MDSKYTAGQIIRFVYPTITTTNISKYNGQTFEITRTDETSAEYGAMLKFFSENVMSRYPRRDATRNENVQPNRKLVDFKSVDLDRANIAIITTALDDNHYNSRNEHSFKVVTGYVVLVGNDVVTNMSWQSSKPAIFVTEAAAQKALKQFRTMIIKANETTSRKATAAKRAQEVCSMAIDHPEVRMPSSSNIIVGDLTIIRAMGKQRVGVVVGSTATKWIVAFTTPSNPAEIREKRINRN